MRNLRIAFLLFILTVALPVRAQRYLTIYAATSLTDAFEALAAAFEAGQEGARVRLNFSSSSTLAAQLIAGAPADIFASANEKQMTLVVEDGRVEADAPRTFAHNQLVLATPADNPADIVAISDLANDGVLLVLAAVGTPIRAYTDAMLESHNAELGADFSERALRNLASEESNVRQVVTRLALGEADAGIVYRTDALGDLADKLQVINIDAGRNQLASYPIAPLSDAANPDLAARFIAFALADVGREILAAHGFCPPVILAAQPPVDATPKPTEIAHDDATDEEPEPADDSACPFDSPAD